LEEGRSKEGRRGRRARRTRLRAGSEDPVGTTGLWSIGYVRRVKEEGKESALWYLSSCLLTVGGGKEGRS